MARMLSVPKLDNREARSVLEEYGGKIQQKAHTEAEKRGKDALQGDLSQVIYLNDKKPKQTTPSTPCELNHEYHTNVTDGHNNPCGNRTNVRFSDIYEGQCTDSKIRGNDEKDCGACAPLRRLFLCDQNLAYMQKDKIKNTHNLLLEVLLAAKYEGKSIIKNYEHLDHHNKKCICTALARSFADIGDIIRGKDLFTGYNEKDKEEKEQLQENLRKIFKNIYEELEQPEKTHYNDATGNYFKLREDWWNVNRLDIWKAITCDAPKDANYFVSKLDNVRNFSDDSCGHGEDAPFTNLDYVPQFLRWFDEWAEDFCRIKQRKLENVKTRCRGEKDGYKYCSRNGYDCEETISAIGQLRMGNECTRCLFGCNPYEDWINKKKQEFDKQKQKYEVEINKYNKEQQKASSDIINIYYQEFYKELKGKYTNVSEFLKSLNEETKCKNLQSEQGSEIDFNNNMTTFSLSQYCKPCPECGVIKKNDGTFKVRSNDDAQCEAEKPYTPSGNVEPTVIDVLSFGDEHSEIEKKLKEFLDSPDVTNSKLNEQWKCYYEVDNNEACILTKEGINKFNKIQKPFDEFFDFWVVHMLKDSIYWRKKLNNCIKNSKATKCNTACKNPCDCYKKWLGKKKKEWDQIKDHYKKQDGLVDNYHFSFLEKFLEDQFLGLIEEAYDDPKEITRIVEMLDKKIMQSDDMLNDEKYIIDILLDHEKDDAKTCIQTHTKDICLLRPYDDEEDEEAPRQNPCAQTEGSKRTKSVKHVAQHFKFMARKHAIDRDLHNLKADAKQGTYSKGGEGKNLNSTFCDINVKYSNSTDNSLKPCQGKDNGGERFKIGTKWQTGAQVETSNTDLYLPPRREHMCTSNLEFLETKSGPLKGDKGANVNNSFLGDVLLSAKMDSYEIKKQYKEQNGKQNLSDPKDKETICRAVRYSFADIGDIIRGRDMWYHKDFETVQRYLETIFSNIKMQLPKEIQRKYTDDDDKHTQLRSDWWEANRHQVWRAMQCTLKTLETSTGDCSYSQSFVTPYDDYIPQRFRWLTEWAQWFCKAQKKEYEKLKEKCGNCKAKDGGKKCMKDDNECAQCNKARSEYEQNIKKWKIQWDVISKKYGELYAKAKDSANGKKKGEKCITLPEEEQRVINFLRELQKANGVTGNASARSKSETTSKSDVYATAEGYVHQEAHISDCEKQTYFCNNGDNNYAFRHQPQDHDDALGCVHREKEDEVCQMVKDLIGTNDGRSSIHRCHPKNYNDWTCDTSKFENGHAGACMAPRRQKLCLYFLKELKVKANINENNLREAFIKTAAAENFLAWHYYKSKSGNGKELDKKLNKGEIPQEFLRSMFYTYGDYRDICLNSDISRKEGDVKNAINNIGKVLSKKHGTSPIDKTRQQWWNENGQHIWKAMLCALEKMVDNKVKFTNNNTYKYKGVKFSDPSGTLLEEFAKRPQFLRWMTEWGEHFCKKQSQEYKDLINGCQEYNCGDNGDKKNKCIDACQKYKKFIDEWAEHYNKQRVKFLNDKETREYKGVPDVQSSKSAREYLDKTLQKLCQSDNTNGECQYKCMENFSTKAQPTENKSPDTTDMPASLDDEPQEVNGKCSCKVAPIPPEPALPESETPKEEACDIVEKLFENKDGNKKYFDEACSTKYKDGKEIHTQWKCISDTSSLSTGGIIATRSSTTSGSNGSICIPPRRRKLYIHKVDEGDITDDKTLSEWFVKSAAVETFFLWHRYKEQWKAQRDAEQGQNGLLFGTGSETGGMKALAPGVDGVPSAIPAVGSGESIALSPVPGVTDGNPDTELKSGHIPPDFLRQMFYTLGDYRDILFSGIKDEKSGDRDIFRCDKVIQEREQKIKDAIQKFFDKSGEHPSSVPSFPSDKDPKEWWEKNGEHIWKGMVCTLTYKESEEKNTSGGTNKIEKDESVYKKFFGENNNGNPGLPPGTTGTFKEIYDYSKVVLIEDDSDSGPKGTGYPAKEEPTKLKNFVERPPYFRYLEEWGETFCGTRKRMLKEVKKACRKNASDNDTFCSGDGHDCTEYGELRHKDMFASLDCPSCYEQCRKYKKWIDIKLEEFQKKKDKYQGELDKLKKANSNGDNNCCKEIEKHSTVDKFLKELKHCKYGQNNSEEKGTEEDEKNNEIKFEDIPQTFSRSTYCETCPPNKVNCNGSGRRRSGAKDPCTKVDGKGKSWKSVFNGIHKNNGNSINITVEMIDPRAPFIKNYTKISENSLFKDSYLFKSLRNQQWECRFKEEKMDVCHLINFDDKIDLNQYTTFKVFLVYWLQDFIESYYILKKNKIIEKCKQNEGKTCDGNSKNNCTCVKKWVEKKESEWKEIKKHFNNRKQQEGDTDMKSLVRKLLEELHLQTELDKAIKPCKDLNGFEKPCGLNGAESSKTKDDNEDAIDCMLKKLKDKIDKCKTQNSGETCPQSTLKKNPSTTPLEHDDEPLEEEENEKTKKQPGFCPPTPKEPEPVDDEDICEDAASPAKPEGGSDGEKEEEKDKGVEEEEGAPAEPSTEENSVDSKIDKGDQSPKDEQPPSLKPEEEASAPEKSQPKEEKKVEPKPPKAPRSPRRQPKPKIEYEHPLLKPALISSTLMWSVGISFAAFSYFLLKKKSKSSVDLLRVLNIPKGEYEMPTLKSKNRYIPYRSGQYKGKTYIYMEGDTSGDEDKYIWDLSSSDITSSESEYEEMDINDIYVPGSPKYKTLIEVVLEPSKSDGNTLGDDMLPTTNTFTDEEWNELKNDFISQYLPNTEANNNYRSGDIPMNTEPNTLYFDKPEEKPFITSIHDRDLYTGEEIKYDINMTNNDIPMSARNDPYSGIDLINDTLSGNKHIDIYDEVLKRKENELFGTKHPKRTSNNSVAKLTNSDPIDNQLNLFHTWLDRHRDMCEQWSNKEDILNKLNEEWNKDNDGRNVPIDNRSLNTDVSIQIDMDHGKPKKEFTNMDINVDTPTMDNILDDLETYNEPFYDIYEDDVYYDVNEDNKTSTDHNNLDVSSKVQIEMDVNSKSVKEKYPISDVWDI
ncbi:erythrocyte membrane protein 1, PfEMP1, putative [Plasmodium sp.]|nr:erythrocyte membrane protein 1, PfEMP1, putative [Plasmodium sp.]